MRKILDFTIGLFSFIVLIFTIFLLPRKAKTQVAREGVIGERPDEIVFATEVKFCPICHEIAAHIRRSERGIDIVNNGRVLVTIGSSVIEKDGKEEIGFPLLCPNGHKVRIS